MTREHCPEPVVLAALVEGTLPDRERRAVFAHLDGCEDCMSAVDVANETLHEEAQPSRGASRAWWIALAAAVVIAIVALPAWRSMQARRSSIDRLVDSAPHSARVIEPRLTGGFSWAAYRGPNRAGDPAVDEERLTLAGEAGRSLAEAKKHPSAETQHTAGVAMLLIEQPDEAIARIETAIAIAPNNPRAWSDLAAARLAAADRSQRPSLYPLALDAADHALQLDPKLAEALFNRALVLERLSLAGEARTAWQRYLDADVSSPWAVEAREHLAKLPATSAQTRFDRERPRLEAAAIAGDAATVSAIVATDRERSRAFGEAEYLGRWGDAIEHGDAVEAAKMLSVARAIGDALARGSGESLLRDAVRAIDSASPRNGLASAHSLYRRGRMLYAKQQLAEAEPLLRDAAKRFGITPMSLVARYYAANTRHDQSDVAGARAELEQLVRELAAHPNFLALPAQVRWELGLCLSAVDDWSGALAQFDESAALFRRLDERSNLGFVETLLAEALATAGRPDEATAARIRSFALNSNEQRGQRLAITIGGAAYNELRVGRRDAARAYLNVAQSAARASGNDSFLADVLVHSALLAAVEGNEQFALHDAAAARDAAMRIGDAATRERTAAFARIAQAAAHLPSDPATARQHSGEAIAFLRGHAMPLLLPLAHLLHARAALRLGDRDVATRDLDDGLAALDAHPIALASRIAANDVVDAAGALFDEAIALSLARGDEEAAFGYADRNRRRIDGTPMPAVRADDVQKKLSGGETAVVEIAVLPGEVVTFTITAEELAVTRRPIARAAVDALASRTDEHALRELHDLVLGGAALDHMKRVVIVSDPHLEGVPFAALLDASGEPLVARMPVAMAMSAASLTSHDASKPARVLLAVGLPTGAASGTAGLPEIERELDDVASSYATSSEVSPAGATFAALAVAAPRADVVHIAGHTERQRGGDAQALVFGDVTATGATIAAMPLRKRSVVVLAACETLRRPRSPHTRSMSLGAGFLAAGARAVVGTLAPITDRDAGALFRDVHRRLAAGANAADAVRDAQLAQIARGDSTGWRALAVLTSEID